MGVNGPHRFTGYTSPSDACCHLILLGAPAVIKTSKYIKRKTLKTLFNVYKSKLVLSVR